MTRNLALDLKPIRVNLVSPGAVDTELWKDFTEEQKQQFFKNISEKVPTGRIGKRKSRLSLLCYVCVTGMEKVSARGQGNRMSIG